MKHLSLALLILASSNLFAVRNAPMVESSLKGSATISQRPEFVTINIDISSECYADRTALSEATNKETNRINDLINTLIVKSRNDTSCIQGGIIQDFHRNTGWGENEKRTCVGTFALTNTISVQYYDAENFADFYNQLNAQLSSVGNKALEEAFTGAKISSYYGAVSEATLTSMETQALEKAFQKACSKFNTISNNTHYEAYFSDRILSNNNGLERVYASSAPKAANNTAISLDIPNIEVTEQLYVTFRHKGLSFNKDDSSDEETREIVGSLSR